MVDRNYKKCTLLRATLVVTASIFTSLSAFSQDIPNDRQLDGLLGRVHVVEEANIGSRLQADTVHSKKTYFVNVQDTQRVFLFSKRMKTRKVRKDTVVVENITRQVPDTLYFCRTEYTPDGYIKSRYLIKDNGKIHEQTTSTYYNNIKLEMRTYCQETGVTTQWHYYYSDYGKTPLLEQVIVTKQKNNRPGEMVERIEYEYENEAETCRERHFTASGEKSKVLKYEAGILTDMSCGADTNLHYLYDNEGRLIKVEVYNADFDLIGVDTYRYDHTGIQLTRTSATKSHERQSAPIVTTFKEEYDGAGNWTLRTIDRKEARKREIKYYSR